MMTDKDDKIEKMYSIFATPPGIKCEYLVPFDDRSTRNNLVSDLCG